MECGVYSTVLSRQHIMHQEKCSLSAYSSVDFPGTSAEYIERIKHSVEVGSLLQERVMLVDICHTPHD